MSVVGEVEICTFVCLFFITFSLPTVYVYYTLVSLLVFSLGVWDRCLMTRPVSDWPWS